MCKIFVLFNLPKCFYYLHLYGLGNIYQRIPENPFDQLLSELSGHVGENNEKKRILSKD